MKKVIATLSVLSMLSLTAVPAFAHDNGNGKSQAHGKIKAHFTMPTNPNLNMSDVKGHWAEKFILDLIKKGVLSGMDAKHFEPDNTVSRAQWAVMVTRYFDLQNTATKQDFTDVPVKSWEYSYVESVKDYFDAYRDLNGNLAFHPDTAATRQDVTVTLVKILTKLDPTIKVMDATAADALLKGQFSDADKIAPVLRPYVATAVQYDLIHGDGKGHFNPKDSLSRAEAATLLDLLLENNIVVGDDQPDVPTTDQSHATALTALSNTIVTNLDNTTHALTVANGTTVAILEAILSVDGGKGTVQVYTDSTKATEADSAATLTNSMVVVATAQDGTTKTSYTIALPEVKSTVTTLTTSSNVLVTTIDNTDHKLTVLNGLTASALKTVLSVDGGKGTVEVFTDSTQTTKVEDSATLTDTMTVVATAQDGTTKTVYTIAL
ncbi:S-layer homology domain-containing protein [Tumebacillus sp. ITR2]|uniref:S-layer homology domain-containing protein n=1 Tax=Tumebacillus amylolyticus TaxID=2801339 RepID=A0ABS1J6J2_9BACL|nr:S-layer homology domain-containing protein [Tumebacillus amylolyticus]MBL0385898.1 S-layer homology domain-containing protein [Tumebacillus amylolyticus]